MDLMKYLESGIIEDYCLGVLNPAEMWEVAHNAERYKAIQNAIDAFNLALIRYAEDLDPDRQIDKRNDGTIC
jgi:hypothetical protein